MNPKKQKRRTQATSPAPAGENTGNTAVTPSSVDSPRTTSKPDYVVAWANMTTGIEDYARWQQKLARQTREGDPPFRRGRIWV